MRNLDDLSPTDVSQYLLDLGKQLSAGLALEQLQLLSDDEINSLQGSAIEHQQAKAIHDLLHECREEGVDLVCRYLLETLILQPKYDLDERITRLTDNPNSRKTFALTETKQLLDNYIHNAQENLFYLNSTLDVWSQLSKNKQSEIESILIDVQGKGILSGLFAASFWHGARASSSGLQKLKQHRGITKYIFRERVLKEVQEGISLQAKTKAKPFATNKVAHVRKGYIYIRYNIMQTKKVANKMPAAMSLNVDIKKGLQLQPIKGGKGFFLVDKKSFIKQEKISAKVGLVIFFTVGSMGLVSGGANVQAHDEQGLKLGTWERLDVFFRGAVNLILPWIRSSPESVYQYTKEKHIADQLAQQGTKFLETFTQFDVYVVGIGQLSENKNKGELTAVPGFSYVNLDQERPDLGEETYLPSIESKIPQKRKKYYQKSRRTPTLMGSDTELVCAPEFDKTREAVGSGLEDRTPYHCKNGFAVGSKIRAANLPTKVYFDLRMTNKGKVIASHKNMNIVDASQLPGSTLYYDGKRITTTLASAEQSVNIETNNINIFLGRAKLVDIVDFSLFPAIDYVATKGGVGPGAGLKDRLMNVPKALLSPHTYVYSLLLEPHQYDIELGNGAIDIDLLAAEKLNLNFNLSLDYLLTRIVINQEEARESSFRVSFNSSFVKLVITVGEMEITLHLLKSAAVILSDSQGHQILFYASEPDSFLMLERIAENVSSEEKLQACHAYQQRTLEDKQLACLMVKVTETETEFIEDLFFIDEGGQGWIFIAGNEGEKVNLISFYSKGVYSLTVSELEKNPSLAIPFPVANINYYRGRNDLVLVRKGYTFTEFSLRLKNYYADPALWKSLRLIHIDVEAPFDCDTGEYCLSGQALEDYSREAISLEDEIKTREQRLFTYYSLMPETNVASQTIYHNQQLSDSGEWQTVTEKEKRFGYLKVEGFNPTDIQVLAEGSDLIFRIKTVLVSNHTFEFRFKNWDRASSYRIEGLIFPGFSSDNLSGFLSQDAALVEHRLKKAVMRAKVYDEAKQLLDPLKLARLKALLVDKLFATRWPSLGSKKTIIANSLGFQDEEDLANFYFISMVSQGGNSAFELFNHEAALQKTTQALYWLAVHTCFVLNDSTMVKKLFPMFTSSETFTSHTQSFCQQVVAFTVTPSSSSVEQFIQAEVTPECLEGVKNWLMEASNVLGIVHYQPKVIVTEAEFYGFKLDPKDANSESDPIYHSRRIENELSDAERAGFIDLSNTPEIVQVHVSQEAEWFKFTFISNSEFNYHPMLIKWGDINQRIEGIVKDGNILVEGLTVLGDPASIESRINAVLFSPERGEQVEIEPRVGAQVHSAYQEEQMLGDQPVNGFVPEENNAAYSTEPPLLGTDPANSSSFMGIITNGVEVNSNLLALQLLLGNKHSSRIPNFSIERQREERMEAVVSTIIPALIEGEGKWEESGSESASGFLNNWPIIGGLGAGVVSLIAGLVWWVKKGRSKNLSSNDVEKGTTLPLNPSNTNNVGNDEYSLNSIPPNEYAPLFGDDEEEDGSKGKGSNGLSSFSLCIDDSFATNDREKTKSEKTREVYLENA